ncbi:blast:Tyrosine-protein phosphatase 99A, partial [Drosophila guanche]
MPRPQHAMLRALLKIMLFASIAEHCATALPTTSSPAPFSAPTHMANNSSSSSSSPNLGDLVNAEAETGSGWETLETEFNLASTGSSISSSAAHSTTSQFHPEEQQQPTAPTSIEQQDQPPEVPATTLSFANAVPGPAPVAGEMANGSGFGFNDATPPYAAVDESY